MLRRLAAELLGTLILVFIACGVATLSFGKGFNFAGFTLAHNLSAGIVATALAFGLVLLALVYVLGPISGCHVNPAVTIGALLARRIQPVEGVLYMVAQFIGGILGALLLWGVFSASPLYRRTVTGLGADGYGKASDVHISAGGAFLVEVILTAIFVFVVLGVTSRIANAAAAGLVIGLTLTFIHLIGIPLTGTSVNPARSLGPALVVGGTALSQVWLFIVAPAIGGAVAAIIHWVIYPKDAPEATETLDPESAS
ncbi:MAG: aquaporin [Acidimicrobiales bacterium]